MNALCNIHNCTEPRCQESEFWCKKHYVQFRAAGMADVNATPPGIEARGGWNARGHEGGSGTAARSKIKPFGKSNGD